jgi:beta-xylosidase
MFRVLFRGGCALIAGSAVVASAGVLDEPAAAASGRPQATTGAPSAVTPTGATLNGTVNPNGASTSYYFEWGTSVAYGNRTSESSSGSGRTAVAVSAALSGLTGATTYHFRLVARNARGTSRGSNATFTTPGAFQNPVAGAASDPFVLDVGGPQSDYWAFNTGNLFPILHSTDLVHWTSRAPALTARPSWVVQTGDWNPWAPSVVQVGETFVMFFVGLSAQFSAHCIGVATSSSPGGPYADRGPLGPVDAAGRPAGCADETGKGNIDPSPFVDPATEEKKPYLYVSTDWECAAGSCERRPTISVIPLTADFMQASGPRVPLFSGSAGTWEAAGVATPKVEGPSALFHDETYYVLYSGGNWRGAYGMGYATAPSPTGPFTKAPTNPFLSETATVRSPGGGDLPVLGPGGGTWMIYHARADSYTNPRTLRLDAFSWEPTSEGSPDAPRINGPTVAPQPTAP